jgi:hypothetical protein
MDIEDIEDIGDIEDIHSPCQQSPTTIKPKLFIKLKPTPVTSTVGSKLPSKLVKSQVISASRRTDIPAFYMDKIVDAMTKGQIEVISPAPYCVKSLISLSPNDVKCFAWWSKDYSNWLIKYKQYTSLFSQYKHLFNFTLIGDPILESGVLSTFEQRLDQLRELVSLFSPIAIKLRFDPITFWDDAEGNSHNNLGNFETVVKTASQLGIKKIIFAFCIPYGKVLNRMGKQGKYLHALAYDDKHPPPDAEIHRIQTEQKKILDSLVNITNSFGIQLETCCGSHLIGYLGIGASKCVDGDTINQLCQGQLRTKRKDTGQRTNCNCVTSRDIGSYNDVCKHKCTYCYANPSP